MQTQAHFPIDFAGPDPGDAPSASAPPKSRPARLYSEEVQIVSLRRLHEGIGECDTPEKVLPAWKTMVETAPWYSPDRECAVVFMANVRRRITNMALVAIGTLDTTCIHAREVFRPAIALAAHAVILAHNHPSGDPTPSEADIRVTRDMLRAGQLLKIELLDHIVIGAPTEERPKAWYSMREAGYWMQ